MGPRPGLFDWPATVRSRTARHRTLPRRRRFHRAVRSRCGTAENHAFKGGESTGVNRVPESLESGRINQANPILQNALGVGARLVRIARFIAVGRVRRNGNQRFSGRRLEAEGEGPSDPRIEHSIQRSVVLPNGEVGILGGGDGGFAEDRSTCQCRTDLAQKLATAGAALAALLAEGFPDSVTSATVFFHS